MVDERMAPLEALRSTSPSAGSAPPRRRPIPARSKKTARAIQHEVALELGRFLRVIAAARRKTGVFDLEALEQATRAALLEELAGLQVSVKSVERQAEAIGRALATRQETDRQGAERLGFPPQAGPAIPRFYIAMDGTGIPVTAVARTREVKLGCVFTQTGLDAEGRPLRDARSTTYTGAIEDAAASSSSTRGASSIWSSPCAASIATRPSCTRRSSARPPTLKAMPSACGITSSAVRICSSAPV